MTSQQLEFADSIEAIGTAAWNGLVGTENPFMRYEFLHALEKSGCTTPESGWRPHHVLLYSDDGTNRHIQGVVPLYLKSNSWGEYVFDWSWANAYENHGLKYYPKFVTAAPFTPSAGNRVFLSPQIQREQALQLIVSSVRERAQSLGASSWHVLFPTADEHAELSNLQLLPRIATQFHWRNHDYASFDEFLTTFNSRKRKAIRKERKHIREQGISFRRTEGAAISEQQWSDFYLYYQSTYLLRGMQGYLTQQFFETIAESMPEQLMLISAHQDGQEIAAALFFKNADTLFGRYWGCRSELQFLHFETCYYQGLDYAIEHGQRTFDSGAQGEHKIQRGFEPVTTYSNHWLAEPAFSRAVADFLQQEKPHIEAYKREAAKLLPFRQA